MIDGHADTPSVTVASRQLSLAHLTVLDTEFLRFEPEHPVGIPEGFLDVSAPLRAIRQLRGQVLQSYILSRLSLRRAIISRERMLDCKVPVRPGSTGLDRA